MLTSRTMAAATASIALAAALTAAAPALAAPPTAATVQTNSTGLSGRTVLPDSQAPFTARTPATGAVGPGRRLTIEVWLRPRTAAAQQFATAVNTPGSGAFHRYLTPGRYATRFGPAPAQVSAVESWLRGQGFTAVHADTGRAYVSATAPVSRINAAFGVQLRNYHATAKINAGPYPLRANDRPVSVPAALAPAILGVTGLDNAAPAIPLERPPGTKAGHAAPCSHYYGQHLSGKLPERFGVTRFPSIVCGYSASQIRGAYGATGRTAGAGQRVAMVELGLTRDMFLTLRDYARVSHLPAPSAARYRQLSLIHGAHCPDPFDGEEQLDVESAYDMAPGAQQLVVGGDSCDNGDFGWQGLFNANTAILDGTGGTPLATVVSNSWGTGQEDQPGSETGIEHAFLVRAAAEGVGMYFSSGDFEGPQEPASDPFAISVGGTTLGLGKTGQRLFETGWSDGQSAQFGQHWGTEFGVFAAGGGPSLLWPQPAYQQGVVPRSLSTVPGGRGNGPVRSGPDISADADPDTGFAVGSLTFHHHGRPTFSLEAFGGTSLAAPLVAALVAVAQQGQPKPFGFTDPVLYQLAGTGAYRDPLPLTSRSPALWRATECPEAICGQQFLFAQDDQSPLLRGYTGQVTLPGYDNMTGLGTPNGQQFIAALRAREG